MHRVAVNLGFTKIRFMTLRSYELSYWSSYSPVFSASDG